jgi:hypothetical protein
LIRIYYTGYSLEKYYDVGSVELLGWSSGGASGVVLLRLFIYLAKY